MRILSVGPFSSNNGNNTSSHRNYWLKHYSDYLCEVDSASKWNLWTKVCYKLICCGIAINLPDNASVNKRIIEQFKSAVYDIVWIDKGNTIFPSTLKTIKEMNPNCILVHYMIDDFMNPYHRTKQIIDTIPLYDYYIVNRTINISELRRYGCKHPIHVYMTYESLFHFPRPISVDSISRLGGDLGFIGTYEKERAESMLYLAENGLKIRIWGNGWKRMKDKNNNLMIEDKGLYSENYCYAICAFKINLAFLRKKSRDLHTTRSSEIPACGGFMIAERTSEHLAMFEEDKEAVFFSSNEELLEKCKYYLEHEEERQTIAKAGRKRCIESDYSNEGMIRKVLQQIMKTK